MSARIGDLLQSGRRSFSFEFFPPKTPQGEDLLWEAITGLTPYAPTFVSVTYGAGGSTRDTTVRVTGRIASDSGLTAMAHLTCVGSTVAEIEQILDQYETAGISNVMALRGDPSEGPRAPWTTTPGGLTHASELVALLKARGTFDIGVAAFPEGHPSAASLDADADVLVAKAEAGASFAVTQMFFRAEQYFDLVERVRERGSDLPILPGIMPILNLGAIRRQGELVGTSVPDEIVERIGGAARSSDAPDEAVRAEGIAIAAELCESLLAGGAPGLHFYTLNRSTATREIFDHLGVREEAL